MSSTTKFTSQAPLLISSTLPLATIAQQPAGSFRERTATNVSFQQPCQPDFPMPDIRKRYCTELIDLPSFAFRLAYILLRLEQTPNLRSCSSRKSIVAAAKAGGSYPTYRPDVRQKGAESSHSCPMARLRSTVNGLMDAPAASSQRNGQESGVPDYRRKSIIG